MRRWLAVLLVVLGSTLGGSVAPARAELAQCPAGLGWTRLPPTQQPVPIWGVEHRAALSVAAGWEAPGSLYVGALGGLHKSGDCGATWQQVVATTPGPQLRRSIPAVAVAPDGVLYIGGHQQATLASQDGGQTWVAAWAPTNNPQRPAVYIRSSSIAPSPSVQGLAYADSHLESLSGFAGIARTRDGGRSWEIATGTTWAYGHLAVDPFDPDTVYMAHPALTFLWRSLDGASTFDRFAEFDSRARALAISTDGSHLWVSTIDGGLLLSRDRGQSWEQVRDRPYEGYLTALSASPLDPRVLFAVTDGGDLWAYREPGPAALPIPGGRLFTHANGRGGEGITGFAVTDEANIPFYFTFTSLPLTTIGYPISQRFTYKGLTTQLFQKLALQARPEGGVAFLNLLDELHAAGKDAYLEAYRSIPPPQDTSPDAGLSWDEVVARHLAILDRDPSLRDAYLSEPRWLDLYGLPTGYGDYPAVSVLRTQRTALQRWKVDLPWAKAGEITVANTGDIAREAGLFPAEALVPQPPPTP